MRTTWTDSRVLDAESGLAAKPGEPVAARMKEILSQLGENPSREGLRDTPKRYAEAMRFLTAGYELSADKIVGQALFAAESSDARRLQVQKRLTGEIADERDAGRFPGGCRGATGIF